MWPAQRDDPDPASLEARAAVVLESARLLHVNGQSTEETIAASERLGRALGLSATAIPRWGELQLQADDGGSSSVVTVVKADPAGVHMGRVSAVMRAMDSIAAGELSLQMADRQLRSISRKPPAPTWLFTLAAAVGAAALSVIFGVRHTSAVALIVGSAGAGAIVRRIPALSQANALVQPLCAAFIAGVIGAFATRNDLSSGLRL